MNPITPYHRKPAREARFFFAALGIAVGITAALLSCAKEPGPDPAEVAAVTGGVIHRTAPIEVVFIKEHDASKLPPQGIFRFSPPAEGSAAWRDPYTLVFTPSAPLAPGERYSVSVGGGRTGIRRFSFHFQTAFVNLTVLVAPPRIDEKGDVLVEGEALAEEGIGDAAIETVVESPEMGKPEWTHENGVHRFRFPPVTRTETPRTVEISWSGQRIGSAETGYTTVRIPSSGVFEVVGLRENEGVVEVAFSAPLKEYADLRGFVSLSGETDVRCSLDSNIIKIFGARNAEGIPPGAELLIQDLEDIHGNILAAPVQYTMSERWELPEVRFAGGGVILPTTQGAALTLETRNVSGVLIEAFRIYGDSMVQFLQVNSLAGEQELDRVGEPVWTKSFDFPWKTSDQNRWVRRGLDCSELARKYPDSLFRVRVSFRRRHIQYVCSAGHGDFSNLQFPGDSFPAYEASSGESSFWDSYEDSPGYSYYEWNQRRKDPCHPAFYMPMRDHNVTIGRNVLISDLGLLAKRALDGTWLVAVSNIKTAKPAANAELRVMNFQGRVLHQAKAGSDGLAALPDMKSLSAPGEPAFIYAQAGFGRAWLKVNDSAALAVSHFDLAGDRPASGLRGLIYGERGVWRPGDDIYLTFLLADPGGTLPAGHPVRFELEDPRGRVTLERTYTSSLDGFYAMTAATAPDAPTGAWTARVQAGGAVFTKGLRIETVMPNRLKMDLDFGARTFLESVKTPVSLESAWLYGAPAPGLKADVSVSFSGGAFSFPGYGDYSFRDPSRTVSSERQTIWEGKLDGEGKVRFDVELKPGARVPGKLSAHFMTRVFEPSGVFSSEQTTVEFSPYSRYVGVKLPKGDAARNMLLTDTDHRAEIAVLDSGGKPVSGNVSLDCAVYKLSWRWWWEKGSDEPAEFASALSRSPVMRGSVNAQDGKASWNFRVNYPDWGRYLVIIRDGSGGHAGVALVYIDWPGWAGRAQEGGQDSSAMLVLTPGKPVYRLGEKVSVSFPSNRDAGALVAVEKGGRIIRREWISCADTSTAYEFPLEPSMIPNVYVHVTLLQPHLQTRNDLPIRLYGVVPVMTEDPRTVLTPRIDAPENWLPEAPASFTVSEAGGRAMVYTVAVVDEGLLGLTRYRLPNPASTFYAREASFLKAWDLYSSVMGAYSGQLETLLAIGGGDDGIGGGEKKPERFKPVVRFFGPYQLKAGERREERFDLPSYVGALRIMVLAASPQAELRGNFASQRAYGTAEKEVRVSSDLMVFGTLPRTLSPGDEAVIPVSVNSYAQGARKVKVSLALSGGLTGTQTQEAVFEKSGEKMVRFTVKAPDAPGFITFSISAESPGLRAARHRTDLEVRSTAMPVTRSSTGIIPPGDRWSGSLQWPGRALTNTGAIELSRFPPLNLEKRLNYLIAYPHGCVEQTTSAVFPQLYLDRIMELEAGRKAQIRANVAAGAERLMGFQTADGGFSYWPGEGEAHIWGSNYAGHFLLEARRAGYAVSGQVMAKWLYFQKNKAALWQARGSIGGEGFLEQAYRLYTLALAGEADLGSMNRLREQRNPALPANAAWRLAAAYWYAGQRDAARSMIRDLSVLTEDYRELSGTFGSALRDKAMILETLVLLGDAGRTKPLFEELSAALSAESWLSTQETAYALIAMTPYMGASASSAPAEVHYSFGGKRGSAVFQSAAASVDAGSLAGSSGDFSLENRSAFPVYARVTAKGLPEEGAEPALAEGLVLSAEYRDMDGNAVDPASLKAGDDMEIRITLRNSSAQAVPEVALVALLPASWEIINYRLAGAEGDPGFKYQDIRDDRVMSYYDLGRGQSKTLSFRVNRAYEGNYFRPAIHAYAMYDESIRALLPGKR